MAKELDNRLNGHAEAALRRALQRCRAYQADGRALTRKEAIMAIGEIKAHLEQAAALLPWMNF